jgi:uncharacterized membrane protein
MTTELDAISRPVGRRLSASSLALLFSICINVGLTSYLAVQVLKPPPLSSTHLEREDANPDSMIQKFVDRLPKADAEILLQLYQTKETQILAATAAAQSARFRALSLLAQPNLDAAALQTAFKEAMDDRERMQRLLAETVLEATLRISPQARMQIAKRYRQ